MTDVDVNQLQQDFRWEWEEDTSIPLTPQLTHVYDFTPSQMEGLRQRARTFEELTDSYSIHPKAFEKWLFQCFPAMHRLGLRNMVIDLFDPERKIGICAKTFTLNASKPIGREKIAEFKKEMKSLMSEDIDDEAKVKQVMEIYNNRVEFARQEFPFSEMTFVIAICDQTTKQICINQYHAPLFSPKHVKVGRSNRKHIPFTYEDVSYAVYNHFLLRTFGVNWNTSHVISEP